MSQANVEKVRDLISSDPKLKQRLEGTKGESALVSALIGIGAEKGLPITEADLEAFKAKQRESEELSDEQLKTVAAGAISYGNSFWCAFCGGQSGTSKMI